MSEPNPPKGAAKTPPPLRPAVQPFSRRTTLLALAGVFLIVVFAGVAGNLAKTKDGRSAAAEEVWTEPASTAKKDALQEELDAARRDGRIPPNLTEDATAKLREIVPVPSEIAQMTMRGNWVGGLFEARSPSDGQKAKFVWTRTTRDDAAIDVYASHDEAMAARDREFGADANPSGATREARNFDFNLRQIGGEGLWPFRCVVVPRGDFPRQDVRCGFVAPGSAVLVTTLYRAIEVSDGTADQDKALFKSSLPKLVENAKLVTFVLNVQGVLYPAPNSQP